MFEDVAGRQAADLGGLFLAGRPHLLDSPVMLLLREKKSVLATICTSHRRGEEVMEEMVAVCLETWGFLPLGPTIRHRAKRQARQAQASCSSFLFSVQLGCSLPHQKENHNRNKYVDALLLWRFQFASTSHPSLRTFLDKTNLKLSRLAGARGGGAVGGRKRRWGGWGWGGEVGREK